MSTDHTSGPPFLRVVRGEPTAEDVAAVVSVLSAFAAGSANDDSEAADSSHWSAPARLHRPAVYPGGVGNWWASGLPR